MFKTQVDDKSIKVGEQAAEDRGKDTRLVTLKKEVPVVKFIACLTNQEHLQHAWDIIFQHSGQLAYHTNTVIHTYILLMTSTLNPRPKLPAILDHIFCRILISLPN